MPLTPWELARTNKVEIVKRLQEEGCILLSLKHRGRRGGYDRPFAALIEWPPSPETFEAINVLQSKNQPEEKSRIDSSS